MKNVWLVVMYDTVAGTQAASSYNMAVCTTEMGAVSKLDELRKEFASRGDYRWRVQMVPFYAQ